MLSDVWVSVARGVSCSFALCLVVAVAGCGPGDNRQPLAGSVTLDGKPLEKGVITLFPQGAGSTAGCEILAGKYSLDTQTGATPGKYRVEILAFRPTGKSEYDVDQKKQVSLEEQYLPSRYNNDSELQAEVVAGGKNVFDFGLKSGK